MPAKDAKTLIPMLKRFNFINFSLSYLNP